MKHQTQLLRLIVLLLCMIYVTQSGIEATIPQTSEPEFLQEEKSKPKDMKILVLIVASDNFPVYKELHKIWRAYMHLDPEHVEAYFVKTNPELSSICEIKDDVIWAKTVTSPFETCYNPEMINKTIISMEFMLPRLSEFDYVIRTNLSSFYVFPNLFKFLETLPRNNCYCAVRNDMGGYFSGSGAGLIFSPDIIELLVSNKEMIWNQYWDYEDVLMGGFLFKKNITLLAAPRVDVLTPYEWNLYKNDLPPNSFHFRVKNPNSGNRISEDVQVHMELLKMFYNVSLKQETSVD